MVTRKTVLVTGASSGIGQALARVFAANGFDLVVTARREQRLQALAEHLERENSVSVDVMPYDLLVPGAVASLCSEIERRGKKVDALVNSAGFGVAGKFVARTWPEHEAMLQLSVAVPSELTCRLLPAMIERGYGRIINVASLAGLVASGAGTVYGASKSFLVNFSTSLAREVSGRGVNVTAVCPGLTRTEFHQRPEMHATVASMPRWLWMDADVVAQQAFGAVMNGKHLLVTGRVNRLTVLLLRTVPRPVLAGLVRGVLRTYHTLRA